MPAGSPETARIHDREYYTVPEVARMLKVSPSTVWRWLEAGDLPAYRVGPRAIRISKQDLDTIITPVRARITGAPVDRKEQDIWVGYDPESVRRTLA